MKQNVRIKGKLYDGREGRYLWGKVSDGGEVDVEKDRNFMEEL